MGSTEAKAPLSGGQHVSADEPLERPALLRASRLADILHALFPALKPLDLANFAGPIGVACWEWGIDTEHRLAAFLAQVGHESGGLRFWHELWGPTQEQLGYDGRADLGNVVPGDGYRYRGRGPIQLTGRANYESATAALGVDLVREPDLAATPLVGFRIAGWFWKRNGCNELADYDFFKTITRRVNGGLNGYEDRLRLWKQARIVLGLPAPPARTEA